MVLTSCSKSNSSKSDSTYVLGSIKTMGEMVNGGVTKLALSPPLNSADMDRVIGEATRIAEQNKVQVYREPDLLVSDLFSASETMGKEVLLVYQGTGKDEYLQLKEEVRKLEEGGLYSGKAREGISRRLGRLLGYPPHSINKRLAANTAFRTLPDFGIRASNVFFYYKDLKKASDFYANILGMELVADYSTEKIFRVASDSYLVLVDAKMGMHTADEPKTVALALITDQLDEWYTYVKSKNLKIKYDYNLKPDRPHDGFVIYDTEGYLLEFERFNSHPENENFLPHLNQLPGISTLVHPSGLGFKATVTWLYYKDMVAMENFYQEVLGFTRVVDQGWAKIYRTSQSGYVGLVDERRGMHSFTEKKAVNVSFVLDDLEGWFRYVKDHKTIALHVDTLSAGPDAMYRAFVGYDPEGYYFEFNTFYEHANNTLLLNYLHQQSEN